MKTSNLLIVLNIIVLMLSKKKTSFACSKKQVVFSRTNIRTSNRFPTPHFKSFWIYYFSEYLLFWILTFKTECTERFLRIDEGQKLKKHYPQPNLYIADTYDSIKSVRYTQVSAVERYSHIRVLSYLWSKKHTMRDS